MKRLLAGTLPVVAMYVLQMYIAFETVQLWVAVATLPFALIFILAYIPERPWREWFGTSLLLLAIGVLFYTLSVVLFRFYGPSYWGRDILVVGSVGLVFTSMVIRAFVLLGVQGRDQEGFGAVVVRHGRRWTGGTTP